MGGLGFTITRNNWRIKMCELYIAGIAVLLIGAVMFGIWRDKMVEQGATGFPFEPR